MGTLNFAGGASLSGSGSNLQSSSGLNFSGSWVDAPAGTVIQMQTAVYSTDTTVTVGGTETATLINMSFTPRLASSKLYIMLYCGQIKKHTAGTNWGNIKVRNTSLELDYVNCGAIGYPDSASDRRIIITEHGVVNSWGTSANNIAVECSASGASSYTYSHQGAETRLSIMEITT